MNTVATTPACPRCVDVVAPVPLASGQGALGEDVCPRCRGRFLNGALTERVVIDELGVERGILRELAGFFSGARLPCAGCGAAMRPLGLRGVAVDLCLGCGGLWLDAGELSRLSGGRYGEFGGVEVPAVAGSPSTASWIGSSTAPSFAPSTALPFASSAAASRIMLGRGHTAVVLASLREPPVAALQASFARTDGLTGADALDIASFTHGVVVSGVLPASAAALVSALAEQGVPAHVVGDAALRVPAPIVVDRLAAMRSGAWSGVDAHFAVGPALRFRGRGVRALVAGLLPSPDGHRPAVPVVDVLLGGPQAPGGETRRLRWPVPASEDAGEAIDAVVATLLADGAPAGRFADRVWRPYPSARAFDRELGWVACRHGLTEVAGLPPAAGSACRSEAPVGRKRL